MENQVCNSFDCPIKWQVTQWTACSRKCGKGKQERQMFCVYGEKIAEPSLCKDLVKPTNERECYENNCSVWKTTNWTTCSKSCGQGTRTRNVYCSQTKPNSDQIFECDTEIKPVEIENCTVSDLCNEWISRDWSECSRTCGNGYQKRNVYCDNSKGGCNPKERPKSYQLCKIRECNIARWRVSKWSEVGFADSLSQGNVF
jgi:hypothetical protein